MTPARWQRAGELFHEAVGMPEAARAEWLQRVCPDDSDMVEEVLSLLGNDQEFIAGMVEPSVVSMMAPVAPPERVGPYRLVRELGRGGMGTVYLAERDDEEYQTQVAIKLVRRGMDTDLILHRFYRERQTLARLQHPHIARLLDGGTTQDNLPYIVMEFVNGARITDYCRNANLSVSQRLAIFLDVCDAVAYAHRHFVVHRDLKPGNILVDERGAVKLLDFGICKLLQSEFAGGEDTSLGSPGPLTPDYASPEQIRGEPTDVASDVYSLGAVLYELLTLSKPHRIEEYTPRGLERGICETEILRPSVAALNKSISRQLRGDLDTILLKALQKEPQRRYVSIEQFAEDIRRHLAHQPVRARPDTLLYRVGKFVRRRSGLVAAAAAILITMSTGVYFSARSARIANENLALVRQLSNTFVFDVYDVVRDLPGSTRARELIVKTGLQYLDNLSANASNDAGLERELAAAYRRIGDVNGNVMAANLGNPAEALKSYQKALALLDHVLEKQPGEREAIAEQITLHQRIGGIRAYTKDVPAALASYRQAEALALGFLSRNPQDESTARQLAEIYLLLSNEQRRAAQYLEARQHAAKGLAILKPLMAAHPGNEQLKMTLASAYSGVGLSDARLGKLREALESFRQAATLSQDLLASQPTSLAYQRELMFVYSHIGDLLGNPNLRNLGDAAGAVAAYRQMADVARRLYEADPADQRARSDYGIALSRVAAALPAEQHARRIAVLKQAIGYQEEVERATPSNLFNKSEMAFNLNFLGDAYSAAGDVENAERVYRQSLGIAEPLMSGRSATVVTVCMLLYRKLGELAARRADRAQALDYAKRAIELAEPARLNALGIPANLHPFLKARGQTAMGLIFDGLAASARAKSDREEARRWLEQSLIQWRSIEKLSSFNTLYQRDVAAVEAALKRLKTEKSQ